MITMEAKMALITLIGHMVQRIDNVGGVPTASNAAHAEAARLADQAPEPLRSAILFQINVAEMANQQVGAKMDATGKVTEPGMLLSLRRDCDALADAIRALPTEEVVTPPPPPPVVVPSGGFVGTVYRSGMGPTENPSGALKWKAYEGNVDFVKAGSDGKLSTTGASGNVYCYVARNANMSDEIGQMGGSPEIDVKVGDVIYMRFTGAASQDMTVSIPHA